MRTKKDKQKAGHYEIQGETIAKFEFFQNGFNPYSRYLDVDKVDLILRENKNGVIRFVEVQVKYIKLYESPKKWKTQSNHCWRFFRLDEFKNASSNLYITLILSVPDEYKGDIFNFPSQEFHSLVNKAIRNNSQKGGQIAKFIITHEKSTDKWFLLTKPISNSYLPNNGIEVTKYRRNFHF